MLHTSRHFCARSNALLQTRLIFACRGFSRAFSTAESTKESSQKKKPNALPKAGSYGKPAVVAAPVANPNHLNAIERQILKAIASGQSYQSIATEKGINAKSVEICRFRIQKKLDVTNIELMELLQRRPSLYMTNHTQISDRAMKAYMNDSQYKTSDGSKGSSAKGSRSGIGKLVLPAAAPAADAVVPRAAAVPAPAPTPAQPPLPPPPPLQPPTPAALKKWDSAPRGASASHVNMKNATKASGAGAGNGETWPAAPKQFQQKVEHLLSHPCMPLMSMSSGNTGYASSAAGARGGNAYAFEEAKKQMLGLAEELSGRAPKMSALMLSNIFYSLGQLKGKVSSGSGSSNGSNSGSPQPSKKEREKQWNLHQALMKETMHPTLLHLLSHILRNIKSSNVSTTSSAIASDSNTSSTTGNTETDKQAASFKDGKKKNKRVFFAEAQLNTMNCIQHVCNGMQSVGIKWADLGHLGQGLLDIIGNPVILKNTRKWDLDHALYTLGNMGLSWYQMSALQRENICNAYVEILQAQKSERAVDSRSSRRATGTTEASTGANLLPYTTKGNSVLHTDMNGPKMEQSTTTVPELKKGGVYGTLQGFHGLGLSLREEEMPEVLFDALYSQVLDEIPFMSGKRIVQVVDIIALMSNRGMHKLPLNVQNALLSRLEQVHHDLSADKISSTFLRALGQITSNLWNESPPSPSLSVSDEQRQILLAIATKCLNISGATGSLTRAQFRAGHHLALTTRAMVRFGLKVDFTCDPKSSVHTHTDTETNTGANAGTGTGNDGASPELSFFLRCLDPIAMDAQSLPTALISISQLADTYGGDKGGHRYKDTVAGITNHPDAQKKLDVFLEAIYPQAIKHIESDAYNQHSICNVLWALGTLGKPWQTFPPKLQQAFLAKMTYDYANKEIRDSVHLNHSMIDAHIESNSDKHAFGEFSLSDYGYPVPKSERNKDTNSDFPVPESSLSAAEAAASALPSSSLLGKMSTNSLDSSMGAVSSFRELLYPNIAELSQMSLYNWFGAIVKAKIPFSELPQQFSASLLVALTDDLPQQGGSTVIQMTEYLSRLNLRVKTSAEDVHVPGTHVPHFLAGALLSQLSRRLHTADSYYLLRGLSALSGLHGAPLSHDLHIVECRDVNYALSTSLVQSTTRAVDDHVALLQHAHEYKALSESNIHIWSSANTFKNEVKKVKPNGVYSPTQVLELVASIQRMTFHMPSNTQAQEVGEMHRAVVHALMPDSLTDTQLLQILSPATAQEGISAQAKMSQIISFLQYVGMSNAECTNILKKGKIYDDDMSQDPGSLWRESQNMQIRSPAHESSSLNAFPMLTYERAQIYSRIMNLTGAAV